MSDASRPKEPFTVRAARRAFIAAIRYANRRADTFTTYHERPKFARRLGTWGESATAREPMAVAMQGPVATQDDFTLETLKIYRAHMPECRLILSTWNDTPEAILAPMADLGVEIVLSEKPAHPGLQNVNMQIVSASNGVRRAIEGGAEWILKTRTDQRLYDPNVMSFLIGTAKAFPVAGPAQKHRIVGVGHGSLKFAPYHVTDQTVFGHAEDMLVYWTPPLREDLPGSLPKGIATIYATVPVGKLCRHGAPESYFASEFLKRRGWTPVWTLEDTWAAYRDRFCFVDPAATDFFWVKAQTHSLREQSFRYDIVSNRHEMGFRDWMLLYSRQLGVEAARDYEVALDATFMVDPAAVSAGRAQSSHGAEILPAERIGLERGEAAGPVGASSVGRGS